MRKPYELRIGICSCAAVYKGEFEGRIIKLRRTSFRLKEIMIDTKAIGKEGPGRWDRRINENGVHFFLDFHKEGSTEFRTFVVRYGNSKRRRHHWAWYECDWVESKAPAPAEIEQMQNWMLELANRLNYYQRRRWLAAI